MYWIPKACGYRAEAGSAKIGKWKQWRKPAWTVQNICLQKFNKLAIFF
jgi:hypothetical protein